MTAAVGRCINMNHTPIRNTNQESPNRSTSGSVSLGRIAKFASTAPNSQISTDARQRAFYLQNAVRKLLWDKTKPYDKQERVCHCMRQIAPFHVGVMINRAPNGQTSFSGLIVCGSVWSCPVCARRITETRRKELAELVSRARAQGYKIILITYTLRHSKKDKLCDLLGAVRDAFRRMKSGRAFQNIKQEWAWSGSVTSLETTHGDNGWHVHLHEMVLISPDYANYVDGCALKDQLAPLWIKAVQKCGFDATWEHGVDARDGDDQIGDYVNKWGIEHELAKAPAKRAAKDGRTPLQLLADYADNGDKQAGALYREYALTFKSSQQLVWSKGLRDRFGLDPREKTDEQLVMEYAENASELPIMAELSRLQWQAVIKADKRAEVLQVASVGDCDLLWTYLYEIGVPQVRTVNLNDLLENAP